MCVTASRAKNRINVCLDGINNVQLQKKGYGEFKRGLEVYRALLSQYFASIMESQLVQFYDILLNTSIFLCKSCEIQEKEIFNFFSIQISINLALVSVQI